MKLISENRFKKDLANIIFKYLLNNWSQNVLFFQSVYKCFKIFVGNDEAFALKVLPKESIKTPATSNNSFTSKLAHIQNITAGLKFEGGCLKHDKVSFAHRNVVNLFIVYKLYTSSRYLNTHSTLGAGLFGSAKLSKIKIRSKKNSGYGIGFDSRFLHSLQNFDLDKNSIIFIVEYSSSVHVNKRKRKP